MKKAILPFYLVTVAICLPNFRLIAQSNQSSGIKNPAPPTFSSYSSVVPKPNQQSIQNTPISIKSDGVQKNQQSQFQKTNHDLGRTQQQSTGIKEDMRRVDQESRHNYYSRIQQVYKAAHDQLIAMNNDSFSVTRAIFLIENAFFEDELSYEKFVKAIQKKVDVCREIIRAEKLNPNDNLAKNYAIQKLFSGGATIYNKKTKAWQPVKPFFYDFEDYRGEKDWTKMFVTNLLQTGKGQCHSLPWLYNILTEQLGATAWLSTAPDHCYIKFPSNNGNIYNFETTQGKIVSDQAIVMSGYITPTAIKNKVYMDTLNRQRQLADLLVDLVQGYREKIKGYDAFTESIINQILNIDSNNIKALMMKADIKSFQFEDAANKVGRPPISRLAEYPEVYKLYQSRNDLYAQIDNSGYQAMPAEVYQKWLQSLKREQQKQESKELQEEIKRMLMNPHKPTLINKTN